MAALVESMLLEGRALGGRLRELGEAWQEPGHGCDQVLPEAAGSAQVDASGALPQAAGPGPVRSLDLAAGAGGVAGPAGFRPLAPDSMGTVRTGVTRLDTLLGGGWPAKSATLAYGPPFVGKEVLLRQSAVAAMRAGIPTTLVVHTMGGKAMSALLRRMDPAVAQAEGAGLVRYIDLHSTLLGDPEPHPNTVFLDDPRRLVQEVPLLAPSAPAGESVPSLLILESASTLLVDVGPSTAFPVLRSLLGRTLHQGGVALVGLEAGMHRDAEVQMVKHLCTGMVEFRKKGETTHLHIEGLETAYPKPGWVEYEASPRSFRLTGSFACKAIH